MPATIELMISPPRSGRIWRPESRALEPATTWNQRGRNTIAPKNPKLIRKVETMAEV